MSRRLVALAAVLAGLVLGSWSDRSSARPPMRDGGNWILIADFHVHASPGDVGLPPWDLQAEARRRGLDVVAVTNHRGTWGGRVQRWWAQRAAGTLTIPGQEVTTKSYHLIGIGIARTVEPSSDLVATIREIQAQGGVAIAAHPNQTFWPAYAPAVLRALDGLEVVSEPDTGAPYARTDITRFAARARAERPRAAFIGASDFHLIRPLGAARTFVVARDYTQAGVLEAIRGGRTVAADIEGHLVGDPDLVAYVESVLARQPAPAADDSPGAGVRWAGFLLAWIGLAALVAADRPWPLVRYQRRAGRARDDRTVN